VRQTNSVNFYLIIFLAVVIILKFFGLISFSWTELFAYVSMFWGIGMFYYSYLKQYQLGIVTGAVLFQIGILLLMFTLFELYNPAIIFIPTVLTIIGTSLLIANLIGKRNNFSLFLSSVFVFVGVVLIVFRGNAKFNSFFSSISQILKEIWVIVVIIAVIILGIAVEFKKEKKD
jgi:hypothetical protein